MERIRIYDGQTYLNTPQQKVNSILPTIVGELAKADYRETDTMLEALLILAAQNPFRIVRKGTGGTVVYINTPNKKRLAMAVLDEIRHYIGEPNNKPTNTADEVLIIEHGKEWLQRQQDTDLLNAQEYACFVANAVNDELDRMNLDDAEHNAIIEAVQEWYDRQTEPATAQPLNDEQPTDTAQAEQAEQPECTNDTIVRILVEWFDTLDRYETFSDVKKDSFTSMVSDCSIAEHVASGGCAKFKAFIRCIRPYYNDTWYKTICANYGSTESNMVKYNKTDAANRIEEKFLKIRDQMKPIPHH